MIFAEKAFRDVLGMFPTGIAVLESSSYAKYDGGDHVIMVGLVEHVETQEYCSPPVCFRGRYHELIPALENPEVAGLPSDPGIWIL
jgi:hypothetical protein